MSVAILTYAFSMAVATFIENDYGTPTAKALIYNTKWFEFLMLLLVINFIGNVFKYRLFRKEKWPVFLFHIAFVITLLGSFTTRYFGFEGIMLIREGAVSNTILSDKTYVHVRVDNGKNQNEGYAQNNKAVLFGQIGSNKYTLKSDFVDGKFIDGKFVPDESSRIPFSIDLVNFTYKAKKELIPNKKGNSYLHIIESNKGGRQDIFLKEGEVKVINNVLFTYNNAIDGAMNFNIKNGINTIKPILNGSFMEMKTQKLTNIAKDSLSTLQFKKLYTFNNLRFVVKEIIKGNLITKTASKKEQSKFPYDILTFKIKSGNEEKNIELIGTSGAIQKPTQVSLNGLNFNVSYGSKEIKTPFSIKLRDFELERYPGTKSASSYASEVTVIDKDETFDQRIYMNHVLDYKGYRFFQSSFDPDEKGTVLSVNHDYWGTLITYIGYLLMGIGMFFSLFWKGSRFNDLTGKLKKLSAKKVATLSLMLLSFTFTTLAQDTHKSYNNTKEEQVEHKHNYLEGLPKEELQKKSVSKTHANKFAKLTILDFKGRPKPVNTYALESLRKIFKKDKYKGLTAEQVLLSAQLYPKIWSKEPIITTHVERLGSTISKDLGFKDNHTTMINFFNNNGQYYLENLVAESQRKKNMDRDGSDKEIINLDERANIWYRILEGSALTIYPKVNDPDGKWYAGIDNRAFVAQDTMILKMHNLYLQSLDKAIKTNNYKEADEYLEIISTYQHKIDSKIIPSDKKIDIEIKYNRYNIFLKLLIFYFTIGFILLFLTFIDLFKPNNKLVNNLLKVFIGIIIIGLVFHTIGLAVRWYVSDHAPWSNSYEATVFIAWVLIIAGLLFIKNRSKFIITAAVLFAGFLLGIAHGNLMSPEMTNLVPVLKSYWLMIHVAIITASYGFLGLGALLGFFVLLLFIIRTPENKERLKDTIKELSYINEMVLTIGLYMLSVGTFLGGVWANESWGRYWSWDPKEVWALISMMIYIFILHMRLVPGLRGKFALNFASMISIATLIMTYFGVNYYLAGMHSYGKGDPVPIPSWLFYFIAFIAVFSIIAYSRYRKIEK